MTSVLSVRDFTVDLRSGGGVIRPVDHVSFDIAPGRTLGLVGESGCGKSVTAMSLLRLLPKDVARVVGGEVRFDGRDLAKLPERELRKIRGKRIGFIFQEPMTALNPSFTVADQVTEPLRQHLKLSRSAARRRAEELMEQVGIRDPGRVLDGFPHQLSGGMRQRVVIAIAIACEPDLLIADEPTTALDVTTQAQILDLILGLQERNGAALLMITHDLGVVAETCQDVAVMYAGAIVERGSVTEIFDAPAHPYTKGLLESLPNRNIGRERLHYITGTVPPLDELPMGCRFQPRCPVAVDECLVRVPEAREVAGQPGHRARCVHVGKPDLVGAGPEGSRENDGAGLVEGSEP